MEIPHVLGLTEIFIVMAATSEPSVTFNCSPKLESIGGDVYRGSVNRTFDQLHGIFFPVYVTELKIWIQGLDNVEHIIFDCEDNMTKISNVTFAEPISISTLTNTGHIIYFEYKIDPRTEDTFPDARPLLKCTTYADHEAYQATLPEGGPKLTDFDCQVVSKK